MVDIVRILVVDDDEDDFIILRDLLAEIPRSRYQVEWASSLTAARRVLAERRHEFVFVDYLIGPDSGLELVAEVAASERRVPVIVLTGQGSFDVDLAAMRAGAADYLVKGRFDAEHLARAIRYALDHANALAEVERSEHKYRLLFERNPEPLWVYDRATLAFLAVNEATVRQYGYSREELLAMGTSQLRAPEDRQRYLDFVAKDYDGLVAAGVWRHQRKDGVEVFADITSHDIEFEGRPARLVLAKDVTEARRHERRLRLLERAIDSSVNGIVIVDARTEDQPIQLVNSAFERMTGFRADEVIGRNCRFLQGEDRDQPELEAIRHAVRTRTEGNAILRNYRKDGSLFWNHLFVSPVPDENGQISHFIGVQNDLTERRRVEADLAFAANHDPVTSLPRYSALEERLCAVLATAEAAGTPVHFLFLDLDRFHTINESMGHVVGDGALAVVGRRLLAQRPAGGEVARFAGDEFVIIAPGMEDAEALALAERLRGGVAVPIDEADYRLYLTASVGISRFPEHGRDPQDLLRRAEAAKGRAKAQGRDGACLFSQAQMQAIEDRLVLGGRLRAAIARDELLLHYQPQIRVTDGRVTGFEALVRWTSPDMGPVSPGRFIPIAEALGLMPEIGAWVFDAACRQARAWLDAGHAGFRIAVNLSAQQLQRPDLVDRVREALQRHRLPTATIDLELTESSLMENVERMQGTLAELKALGLSLSLDDFGTGYSSLAYLKQFALDKLKIDQSFVRELPDDADDAAIARTIVAMAHQLRMKVAAEGVETAAQSDFLRELGCDELQGYFHGRPVPATEAEKLLGTTVFAA